MTYHEASQYFKAIHKENLALKARRRAVIQRRWDRRKLKRKGNKYA